MWTPLLLDTFTGRHLYWTLAHGPSQPMRHFMADMIQALGETWSRRKPIPGADTFHYKPVSRWMVLRLATESYQSMFWSMHCRHLKSIAESREVSASTHWTQPKRNPKYSKADQDLRYAFRLGVSLACLECSLDMYADFSFQACLQHNGAFAKGHGDGHAWQIPKQASSMSLTKITELCLQKSLTSGMVGQCAARQACVKESEN